ncbi:TetR family transcriptional regulator [Mucilaginibacter gracilis]|uniref:TetR family transcriptional regulator n=1 Tax=Mucilaginibacter gracilis TaxID=423350 RepID=A0A495J1V3_9SPHI|nr:TetR/AcrR family transcriptional regulator [Mucilaginibacter gracilis]RKR82318.1 TetR family transcriptional regulator [Mucilaginibacter gracilis]
MASKDRILRLKEETRINILDASLQIVKEEGWQALSMRKIADVIEYTAPLIYEYFANKEAIILELTRKGFLLLSRDMELAKNQHQLPAKQLEAMWLAYWNFAFAEKELYQVMFGVNTNCCELAKIIPESEVPYNLIAEVIEQIMNKPTEDEVCTKYFTFWSVIHGLISINLLKRGRSDEMNHEVLITAINGITRSLND